MERLVRIAEHLGAVDAKYVSCTPREVSPGAERGGKGEARDLCNYYSARLQRARLKRSFYSSNLFFDLVFLTDVFRAT